MVESLSIAELHEALWPGATSPRCPRCGVSSNLVRWVELADDELCCGKCHARSTKALLVRLVAEDGEARDRALDLAQGVDPS